MMVRFRLPLTQSVNFKTTLKRANRLPVEPLKVNKSQNKSRKVKKHQCRNLFFSLSERTTTVFCHF